MSTEQPIEQLATESAQPIVKKEVSWDKFLGEETPVETPKETQPAPETPKAEQPKQEAVTTEVKTEAIPAKAKTEPKLETEITPSLEGIKFDEELKLGTDLNYVALGKRLGLDISDDNLGSFEAALKLRDEGLQKKASEQTFLEALEKQDPKAQVAFVLASEGYDLAQIANPVAEIDSLLRLSNYDLLKQELQQDKRLSQEDIDKQLEELAESGQIDAKANSIRRDISEIKNERINSINSIYSAALTKQKQREEAQKNELISGIEQEILASQEYAGMKLPDSIKNSLISQVKLGKFDDVINNKKAIAELIIHKSISNYALNEIKQKTREAVLNEQLKKMHNIPNAGNNVVASGQKATGLDIFKE